MRGLRGGLSVMRFKQIAEKVNPDLKNCDCAVLGFLEQRQPLQFVRYKELQHRDIACWKASVHNLSTSDQNLLRRALKLWNFPEKFSDADVANVKMMVRQWCALPAMTKLNGFTSSDSVSFVDTDTNTQYHLHSTTKKDKTDEWTLYKLTGEFDMTFRAFSDVLEIMDLI